MRHGWWRMGAAVFAAVVVCGTAAWAGTLGEDAQTILDETVVEENLAGLSAAIAIDGEIVWSGGAGYADLENGVPATGGMVHRIGSISKPITAVGVMRLVEEGRVRLDEPIQTYAWTYPEKEWPVTVRHLLTHTSGIRHYRPGEFGTMEHFGHFKAAVKVFQDDPLLFEPGTKYGYSTYAYTVLGLVLEEASEQRFGEFLAERVWKPAGMEHTRLELRGEIVPGRARGYTRAPNGELANAAYDDLSVKYPGGGMISTVEDLARFATAFYGGRIVSEETRDAMLTAATTLDGETLSMGLGWGVGNDETFGRRFSHSGGQHGTNTLLMSYIDRGITVAVISNVDGTGPVVGQVMRALRDRVGAETAAVD